MPESETGEQIRARVEPGKDFDDILQHFAVVVVTLVTLIEHVWEIKFLRPLKLYKEA